MRLFSPSKYFAASLSLIIFTGANSYASDTSSRPDHHAPIGVMRDHVHKKGETMLSYRYSFMQMKGARKGSDRVSSDEVLSSYMVAPADMEMRMRMFGAMHGITDKFTIAAMGSLIEKQMHILKGNNQIIDREVSGLGDTKVNALYEFFNDGNRRIQLNAGVSVPTGDINRDYNGARQTYAMQLGSGSYEALPGISYTGYKNYYSYGAQANAVFRLNSNNVGYKLGDSYNFTAWAARKLNDSFSLSYRVNYTITESIKGVDKDLNAGMSHIHDYSLSGGRRLDLLLGTNFIVPSGYFKGNRLALEGGMPVYQNLNGTQLETDYKITLGWQKNF